MQNYTKKRYLELLEEVVDDKCHCDYCFLKIFLESMHPDARVLVQLKCIEKFKWEKGEELGKDIGWNEAGFKWVEEGFATAFNKAFDEEKSIAEVYSLTKKIIYDKLNADKVKNESC